MAFPRLYLISRRSKRRDIIFGGVVGLVGTGALITCALCLCSASTCRWIRLVSLVIVSADGDGALVLEVSVIPSLWACCCPF